MVNHLLENFGNRVLEGFSLYAFVYDDPAEILLLLQIIQILLLKLPEAFSRLPDRNKGLRG
ncbi:hypothetical protein D3C71_1886160 [compost metagenome]